MDIISRLLAELGAESPNIETLKTLVGETNGIMQTLKSQSESDLAKFNEAKISRDKAKATLQGVKTTLGLDANTPIDLAILETRLKGNATEEIEGYIAQLGAISKEREAEKVQYQETLDTQLGQITKLTMGMEINKLSGEFTPVNASANSFILDALHKGAFLENGVVKYKNELGVVMRNNDGVESTPLDVLRTLEADSKFLFKSDVQEGEGNNRGNGNEGNENRKSAFSIEMSQRAKAKGY